MAATDIERVIADTGADVAGSLRDVVDQINLVTAVLRRRIVALETETAALRARLGDAAPEITGSRVFNPALESLLSELDGIGLVVDSTTAS